MHRALAWSLPWWFAAAASAAGPAPVAEANAAPPQRGGEPAVKRTVVEDDGSRIEELRIRGQVRSITVQPKVGPRARYEIITGDALRQPPAGGGNAAQGAAGQRVWHVLSF
jgi:hypothetical protein